MTGTYGLWLVPNRESEEYDQLSSIIKDYSEMYDDAPNFEPHVSITGGLEVTEEVAKNKTKKIIEQVDPVDIGLKSPHCSTTRYQCVFLLVEPTLEVLEINRSTINKFNKSEYMYVPHLSIIYSDIGISERVQAMQSLYDTQYPDQVKADTIQLLETTGTVDDWEMIEDYKL